MRKLIRQPAWLLVVAIICIVLIPTLPLLRPGSSLAAHAAGPGGGPIIPHLKRHPKTHPHHLSAGVQRSHLPTLTALALHPGRAGTGKKYREGALVGANSGAGTTTLFFDNFESNAPGWTTIGDNQTTSYYTSGHNFWSLAQSPDSLSVPGTVNPNLVSYPDPAGALPAAYSGTHTWWYGDNPAVDTQNPAGASMTYMGNQSDWPPESTGNGGTSNGSNMAALISPVIDLTSAPNATLTFATWWEIESVNPAHFDMMYVDVSTDGGNTWTTVGVLNPTQSPPGGMDSYPYTDNGLDAPASWQAASVDLTPYVGSHVQARFRFDSIDQYDNGFRGWFIDDVGVYSSPLASPLLSTVTPDAGVAGDTVTIAGSGFGAQQGTSTVTFHGVAATIQNWSNSSIVATVPAGATSGPLIVTVNGAQTAAVQFTINASITLSSPTSSPETVNSLSGQGFAAHEPVSIYINGVNGTLLASATVDASGNLPVTNITLADMPAGNYLLLAVGQNSHITAGATLSIVPSLSTPVSTVKTGQSISLTGLGFAAYESVQVQLDNLNSNSAGYLYCDGNGDCSGSASMPTSSVTQGLHLLIGVGTSSALVAEAPVTFTPSIALAPIQGGPDTALSLSGASFVAHETVQVYWGKTTGTLEGTATADNYGNITFSFNVPTNAAVGKHTITVARKNQKPAALTATFTILPPVLTSTAGITNGQTVDVQVANFEANEQVTISWNANGGQQLASFYVGSDGSATDSFVPPSAPHGTYTLTALGASSGLQATSSLNVGPGILLTPPSANPGGTITVSGGGFTANEAISVYFQTTANGVVSATTDATGAFSVSLTVPATYKTTVTYYVYATNTANSESAQAQFSFVTPYVYANNYYPSYGTQETIYGQGFLANEPVNLYWNYQQAGQVKVATAIAGSDGTFRMTFNVPSDPNLSYVNFAAIGATSHLKSTGYVYEYANVVLAPSSGAAGTTVHVKVGGFDAGEVVTVTYQGTTVGTVTTASNGSYTNLSFVVPAGTGLGYTTVAASGATSGISVSATFTVTPSLTITPATGTSGTKITLVGKHYSPSSTYEIYWYDPSTGNYTYFGAFTTSATGGFKKTITVPTGLVSGNTYYVQAYDGPTGIFAQAAFVAQ